MSDTSDDQSAFWTAAKWVFGAGATVVLGLFALVWKASKRDAEFTALQIEVGHQREELNKLRARVHDHDPVVNWTRMQMHDKGIAG